MCTLYLGSRTLVDIRYCQRQNEVHGDAGNRLFVERKKSQDP
jgi:hypothetical protein